MGVSIIFLERQPARFRGEIFPHDHDTKLPATRFPQQQTPCMVAVSILHIIRR
jgi:hypothetical protein